MTVIAIHDNNSAQLYVATARTEFVSQIVAYSGYYGGYILTYMANDPDVENARAVTHEHLYSEVARKLGKQYQVRELCAG